LVFQDLVDGPAAWALAAEPPSWVLERRAAEGWPAGILEQRRDELRRLGAVIVYAYFREEKLSWIEAGDVLRDIDWTDAAPLENALNKILKELRGAQK
jgi:hypothetical protein